MEDIPECGIKTLLYKDCSMALSTFNDKTYCVFEKYLYINSGSNTDMVSLNHNVDYDSRIVNVDCMMYDPNTGYYKENDTSAYGYKLSITNDKIYIKPTGYNSLNKMYYITIKYISLISI